MSSSRPELVVDWCSHEAAKYAVLHWHYSKVMPAGKLAKLGVWENKEFIGVVIFGLGANNNIGKTYGLRQSEACELVRVALRQHVYPVSKIVSYAIKKLAAQSPAIRLIVSYADPQEGHNGAIYQAMNWIYVGMPPQFKGSHYRIDFPQGQRVMHGRSVRSKWGAEKNIPYPWQHETGLEKYKYLYPLDKAMRRQIEPLAQPYPKREACGRSVDGSTTGDQPGGGGSIPTRPLDLINNQHEVAGNTIAEE